ncbi:MAG: hypothetical protein ACKVJ2_14985, partial [Pseudomonadales bacterium]
DEPDSFMMQVPSEKLVINTYMTGVSRGSKNIYYFVGSKFTPEKGHKYEISVLPYTGAIVKDITVTGEKIIKADMMKSEVCQ